METFLANLDYSSFPAYAILAYVVISVLRGNLNPKSYADGIKTERDDWKKAYFETEKASRIKDQQIGELLEVARTANHIIRSLPGGDPFGATQQTIPPAHNPNG